MLTEGEGFHSAEIDGSEVEPATLRFFTQEGRLATLTAGFLLGKFEDGAPRGLEAFQGIHLVETLPGEGTVARRLDGERGEGTLNEAGELVAVKIQGEAEYQDEEVRAQGERISFNGASGIVELSGPETRLTTSQGELVAPEVTFDRASGVLQASGGTRSVLEDPEGAGGALAGSPLAAGEGPIRVEAEETFWRQEPSAYLFRGRVRAWRGANLILADSLRLEEADRKLEARGSVKTVWTPEDPAPGAAPPTQPATTVTSQELDYSHSQGVALYRGSVRTEQDGRILTAEEMEVELLEGGQMERLTCREKVKLDDPTQGNVVEADHLVYTLAEGLARFFGQPVVSRDREGRVVRAQQMVYDTRQGRVVAGGREGMRSQDPAQGTPEGAPEAPPPP
jgi:lipopolysaccharide transport protein LptA